MLTRACNLAETRTKEGVLSARHRNAFVTVVAMSLASTLTLDVAYAQSASSEPSSPMLPASDEPLSGSSEPTRTGVEATAEDGFSLEGSAAPKDRLVLKPPPSTRWVLIGAGFATTGAFYAASYGIGGLWPDAPGHDDLRIPIAGPFMDLAHTGCPKNDSDCSTFELVVRTVFVSFDLLGQLGGVGLLLEGALFSPSGIEPQPLPRSARLLRRTETASVVAVPWTDGRTGIGLGLAGRF